jgi:fused signal recognition particle receptor
MPNNVLNSWIKGLEKTRKATFGRVASIFGASEITDEAWDNLEATLIQADVGIETTLEIVNGLRKKVVSEGYIHSTDLQNALREDLLSRLAEVPSVQFGEKPAIILIVGVNGSGKTTTIAKLGKILSANRKQVLFVAADTFRAAAVDQLKIWGERLNIPVIAGQPDGDPGAVAFDGVQAAIARKIDYVLIDTAGRLQTRYNLMEELKKVNRVVNKALPGAPHATWIVLDATTGQNALQQASAFKEAVKVNGVILAKLDSSAKGGMVFAIKHKLGLPVLFAGLGEKPEDLVAFDPNAFVDGILSSS